MKILKNAILFLLVSLPTVLVSWFVVCDRCDTRAQGYFNERFDTYYPVRHAPCSTRVALIAETLRSSEITLKEMSAEMKFLVLLEQQRMTWKERQKVVDALVKNDSLSYEAAYNLINSAGKIKNP